MYLSNKKLLRILPCQIFFTYLSVANKNMYQTQQTWQK